jgi:hypothetical protein
MTHYFLMHDAAWFQHVFCTSLAQSWRDKSFQPCQSLCAELTAAARTFADSYRVSTEGSLVAAVAAGLPFDRRLWRGVVGEALLFGAREIPEIDLAVDSLTRLLAPSNEPCLAGPRELLPPILQAHFGARDLEFGRAIYRPEQVGMNDLSRVRRLTEYLASVDASAWTADDLASPEKEVDEEDRGAELDYVRTCFAALRLLYEKAGEGQQIIVCESL